MSNQAGQNEIELRAYVLVGVNTILGIAGMCCTLSADTMPVARALFATTLVSVVITVRYLITHKNDLTGPRSP